MSTREARVLCRAFVLLAAAIAFTLMTLGGTTMAFTVSSSAFKQGAEIPKQYTCEGQDVSPDLSWSGAPAGTKSFALIADDPDAPVGTWVHWVAYDLPGDSSGLPRGVPASDTLSGGGKQGVNDFRKTGYGGPCPPPGRPHRYFFKLYALDAPTNLKPRAAKAEVLRAIEGHVLAQAELMGTYKR
jgi:Raf kinase inhibitor-like YbhB/YbcL family protein